MSNILGSKEELSPELSEHQLHLRRDSVSDKTPIAYDEGDLLNFRCIEFDRLTVTISYFKLLPFY